MLKIRLQRVGRKHDPSFRVVLTDSKNGPKSGKFLEILGNYDAKKDIKIVNGERIKYWMSQGAQVSDTVHNILVGEKVIEGKKVNVLPKKTPVINEEKIKAEAEAVEAKVKAKEEAKEEAKSTEMEEVSENEEVKEVKEEVKKDEVVEEIPVTKEVTAEETTTEKTTTEEAPKEEVKEEAPEVEDVEK